MGFYLGLTGIFEYLQLKQFVFPSYIMNPWIGVHWGRARGPFMNSGINGAVTGMISALERLLPMTQMGMPIELIGQIIMFGLQGMKGGRELESLVTNLIDQSKQEEPQQIPAGMPQIPEGMPQIPQAIA